MKKDSTAVVICAHSVSSFPELEKLVTREIRMKESAVSEVKEYSSEHVNFCKTEMPENAENTADYFPETPYSPPDKPFSSSSTMKFNHHETMEATGTRKNTVSRNNSSSSSSSKMHSALTRTRVSEISTSANFSTIMPSPLDSSETNTSALTETSSMHNEDGNSSLFEHLNSTKKPLLDSYVDEINVRNSKSSNSRSSTAVKSSGNFQNDKSEAIISTPNDIVSKNSSNFSGTTNSDVSGASRISGLYSYYAKASGGWFVAFSFFFILIIAECAQFVIASAWVSDWAAVNDFSTLKSQLN